MLHSTAYEPDIDARCDERMVTRYAQLLHNIIKDTTSTPSFRTAVSRRRQSSISTLTERWSTKNARYLSFLMALSFSLHWSAYILSRRLTHLLETELFCCYCRYYCWCYCSCCDCFGIECKLQNCRSVEFHLHVWRRTEKNNADGVGNCE
jgi:hypothetical protein